MALLCLAARALRSALYAVLCLVARAAPGRRRRSWLRVTVIGDDMAPTYRAGQRLRVRRLERCAGTPRPRRSDVVVFRPPSALSFQLDSSDLPLRVARVIAAGGDATPDPDDTGAASAVPPRKLLVAGDSDAAGVPALIDADDVVGFVR